MLKNFILRGSYLNYYVTKCIVENKQDLSQKIPGFRPSEIDYELEDNTKGTIILDPRESLYVSMNDLSNNNNFLEILISDRLRIEDNKKAIDETINNKINILTHKLGQLNFLESEYVVPSNSSIEHSEERISHKGTILLELIRKGYPVPDFCILSSKAYLLSFEEREQYITDTITNLENLTFEQLDDDKNPLIFAIRCAMPSYIPGVMPTFLNVGVTKRSYKALERKFGKVTAQMIYLNNLQTIDYHLFKENYNPSESYDKNISKHISKLHNKIFKRDKKLLTDAKYQVDFFVKRAYEYYEKNQDILLTFFRNTESHPSLIFQKMVWTVGNEQSHPGVLYSRHSRTGLGIQIESMSNVFGEEIMTGLVTANDDEFFDRDSLKNKFPAVYHIEPLLSKLEEYQQSPVTIEFAAEANADNHLFAILQLNNSELTGRAILLSAVDLYQKKIISGKRLINLIKPYHLNQIFSERIDRNSLETLEFFGKGISILPRSAVSAKAYFSAASALDAKKGGDKVCFCKNSFVPTDTIVMGEVDAIISLTPAAIHVVTACKGYGVPAFINLEKFGIKLQNNKLINKDGLAIKEGDWITISSKKQNIYVGKAKYTPARFQKYLEGQKFKMNPKEEIVFINMAKAFKVYDKVVENLQLDQISELDDLIKLIRNDLQKKPEKAKQVVNSWFDKNLEYYVNKLLKSELGTHQDQNKIYDLLTTERKVLFFKKAIEQCLKADKKGFSAGSFMLGRFICIEHPVDFWNAFEDFEAGFMINEYILFEKYLNVLHEVGEREVNRARKRILNDGLGEIRIRLGDAMIFMPLKLSRHDLNKIRSVDRFVYEKGTLELIDLLLKPYNHFFNYRANWSISRLKDLCEAASVALPEPEDI